MKATYRSTVMNKQGQIFLPKALRQKLNLGEGGPVEFVLAEDGKVEFKKLADRAIGNVGDQ